MAYSLQPKKMLALNLLELLRKYSDENHRLSQQELLRLLESEYGMTADRKSVRRNLLELQACGYPVCCDERPRAGADGEDGTFCTGWYIERAFTDAELRLLIDSLLSSRSLPESQCASLIRKIEDLSSVHFRSRLTHVRALPGALPRSDQFFYTVEILDEAITSKKQVSFAYCEYGVDKKPHPRTDGDGRVRRYVVNPYQMVAANGRYYLICNYDKYDDISNYRVDRIKDLEILDEPAKPFESLPWAHGRSLDLAAYMREHPYMYSSENVRAKLKIVPAMVSDAIDMFGKKVRLEQENGAVTVTLTANEMALKQFAKNFAPDVVVLEPQTLRDQVREELERGATAYRL